MLIRNEEFNINRDVLCRSLLAHFYPAGDYVHLLQPLALCINFFYAGLGLLKVALRVLSWPGWRWILCWLIGITYITLVEFQT